MISPDIAKLIGLIKTIDEYLIEAKKILLRIAEENHEQTRLEGSCSCHPKSVA